MPSKKVVAHTLGAFGGGAAVFLAGAETITSNPWLQLGCASGLAVLVGLGIAQAKRSAP